MTVLDSIASVVTHLKDKFTYTPVRCKRCLSGGEAQYYVYSDIIHIPVCKACAVEAANLGLQVVSIDTTNTLRS